MQKTDDGRKADVKLRRTGTTLQVVFKLVERCNINCSYCYYFNMGDNSALERPVKANAETVATMADWLARGCGDLGFRRVLISFHGGEPMLVKPDDFRRMCEILRTRLAPVIPLGFTIQTNGTVLTDEWLELFDEYQVHVGVSVDGDRAANDRFRLDFQGRSTFALVERNLREILAWSARGNGRGVSTISVIDHRNDYREIYRYLRSLGVRQMSFLLPDRSRDDAFEDDETSQRYGECLTELFAAWMEEDDAGIFVRQISEVLQHFQVPAEQGIDGDASAGGSREGFEIIVMHSDGSVTVNDSYIPALTWYERTPSYSIHEHSLRELLNDPIFAEVHEIESTLPTACLDCGWRGMCRGGDIENRFSAADGFDNPSVYCDGYKRFYADVSESLVRNGYPQDVLDVQLQRTLPTVAG